MKGEAKEVRDQMDATDAEVKKLTNKREDLWVKLRQIQEQCNHEFKKDAHSALLAELWGGNCVKCGQMDIS